MKLFLKSLGIAAALTVFLVACGKTQPEATDSHAYTEAEVSAAFTKGACGTCHTIPGIPNASGMIGPNLADAPAMAEEAMHAGGYSGSATTSVEFIKESITNPSAFVAAKCPTGPCPTGVMPANFGDTLSKDEVSAIVQYLNGLPNDAFGAEHDSDTASAPAAAVAQDPTTGADIVRDPADLPAPVGNREPQTVRIDLEATELEGQLADGTTYTYWTFNNQIPAPMIRVRVGDTIEVHLKNSITSIMNHSIDLHAVTGPGGGAVMSQTKPGEETTFTAKMLNPGLYVYHCATPMIAQHISNGMYGMILVEPEGGLPPVDREFYVMQGEIYTSGAFGQQGHQAGDTTKLLDEDPEYFVFNGAVGALTTQKPLTAKTGETVRIFFGVGGPNFTSSFHVIGEIFDRVYNQASLTSSPLTDVQTTLVPSGGATMVEFKLDVPGRYLLVDHALARAERGLAGFLIVDGAENHDIYNGTETSGSGH
ncbi:MAG: nitrite reductase, copper-containing [Anaerolineales bacterium]|nr:nitrite reductase, copper-containing [Anaerolineales bacterium]